MKYPWVDNRNTVIVFYVLINFIIQCNQPNFECRVILLCGEKYALIDQINSLRDTKFHGTILSSIFSNKIQINLLLFIAFHRKFDITFTTIHSNVIHQRALNHMFKNITWKMNNRWNHHYQIIFNKYSLNFKVKLIKILEIYLRILSVSLT
jgi:hypothetical protein